MNNIGDRGGAVLVTYAPFGLYRDFTAFATLGFDVRVQSGSPALPIAAAINIVLGCSTLAGGIAAEDRYVVQNWNIDPSGSWGQSAGSFANFGFPLPAIEAGRTDCLGESITSASSSTGARRWSVGGRHPQHRQRPPEVRRRNHDPSTDATAAPHGRSRLPCAVSCSSRTAQLDGGAPPVTRRSTTWKGTEHPRVDATVRIDRWIVVLRDRLRHERRHLAAAGCRRAGADVPASGRTPSFRRRTRRFPARQHACGASAHDLAAQGVWGANMVFAFAWRSRAFAQVVPTPIRTRVRQDLPRPPGQPACPHHLTLTDAARRPERLFGRDVLGEGRPGGRTDNPDRCSWTCTRIRAAESATPTSTVLTIATTASRTAIALTDTFAQYTIDFASLPAEPQLGLPARSRRLRPAACLSARFPDHRAGLLHEREVRRWFATSGLVRLLDRRPLLCEQVEGPPDVRGQPRTLLGRSRRRPEARRDAPGSWPGRCSRSPRLAITRAERRGGTS